MASSSSHLGIIRKYPSNRNKHLITVYEWLKAKRDDDGAEGLWRINDDLYDLSPYIKNHPGGRDWLELTKGTDITEAFEVHHLSETPRKMLIKFYVRKAIIPRNSLITFNEDGFYKTLKRKIRLKIDQTGPTWQSRLLCDFFVCSCIFFAVLSAHHHLMWSLISGTFLQAAAICTHNFFHMKDNWRMYYFNLSTMSFREWRISHVLSHHLYPNTILDLEISMFEPFFYLLPNHSKTKIQKYASWFLSPFIYLSLFYKQFIVRILEGHFNLEDLISFGILAAVKILSGATFWKCTLIWILVITSASFLFGIMGLTAAHHHPDIYHEGDFIGENTDFGILQLAAVRDRVELSDSFLMVMISFGDHALHHLFPCIDHKRLSALYPTFYETCDEFGINYSRLSLKELVLGMYRQMARTTYNKSLELFKRCECTKNN